MNTLQSRTQQDIELSLKIKDLIGNELLNGLEEKKKISEDEKQDLLKMLNESNELIRQTAQLEKEFFDLIDSYVKREAEEENVIN